MVRFLLITAQRRDEAASLRYGHILDGVWRQTENKASRPHSLHIAATGAGTGRKAARRGIYVFAGRSGGKIGAFSRLKRALDEASGVSDWRLHDLRRTAATNMQELGIRNEVVQVDPQPRGARRRWRLPAKRTGNTESRGVGDMGHGADPDRRAGPGGGMTATKKTSKKKQPTPRTTAVKDRLVGIPLGYEAQMLAQYLRGRGADPKSVPDPRDDVARSEWTAARGRDVTRVPMWYLDWAAAILEQIPRRSLRKPGRPKTEAVRDVEFWADVMRMPGADAARLVATIEARRSGDDMSDDAIEERAEQLAHEVYRRRKSDMP